MFQPILANLYYCHYAHFVEYCGKVFIDKLQISVKVLVLNSPIHS